MTKLSTDQIREAAQAVLPDSWTATDVAKPDEWATNGLLKAHADDYAVSYAPADNPDYEGWDDPLLLVNSETGAITWWMPQLEEVVSSPFDPAGGRAMNSPL